MAEAFNCPSCAAELKKEIQQTKHIICEYCQSSIFLEDDSIKDMGKIAQLAQAPSILELGQYFEYRGWNFIPVGKVRYGYGRGWWEEWYVTDTSGATKWISIDEGHIAIEEKEERSENIIHPSSSLVTGSSLELEIKNKKYNFIITEMKRCKCLGAEGELPFVIIPDEKFHYVDLLTSDGVSATIEIFDDGTQDLFLGSWVDPFDINRC